MSKYKVSIKDRNYSVWEPADAPDPLLHKLFHEDEITVSETGLVVLSHVRDTPFPAILVLNGGKTFGRTISNSMKPGRLLYQCVPDNPRLPIFLVPYDIKPDFSKVVKNKYVIVKFDHWRNAHPQGILESTLGNVDEYFPFSEYQLHCRNLIKVQDNAFSEFTKAARQWKAKSDDEPWIRSHLANPEYKIADLSHIDNIMSVDPEGCEDIDDAFSIRRLNQGLIQVSIYIANVPLWLSVLDLWRFIDNGRITTVYLPDRKVPMLPTVLSEDLCSLKAGKLRYAFVMHANFKDRMTDGSFELASITYENAMIRVKTNYAYEDNALLKSDDYSLLKQIAQTLDKECVDSHDSHEVVATFMKFMNKSCAETLATMNTGIFRNQKGGPERMSNSTEGGPLSGSHRTVWSAFGGPLSATYSTENEGHAHMGLSHYTHITSPIRRLVDLINMRILMNGSKIYLESSTIEKINKMSKSAKKAQMDCELYSKVLDADPKTIYTGAIVDIDTDEFGKVTHTIYLEELNTYARVINNTRVMQVKPTRYRVHIFDDEHSLRRKIRVECIDCE
jgi:exoribonuclease R